MASRAVVVAEPIYEVDPFNEAVDGDKRMTEEEIMEKLQEAVSGTIQELEGLFREQQTARGPIETRWLEDLRQYHGVYEANVTGMLENDKERSHAFINMTRPKTVSWEARLVDMLFPTDDKNWGTKPTPVPDLIETAKNAANEIEAAEKEMLAMVEEQNAAAEQAAAAQADPNAPAPDPAEAAKRIEDMKALQDKLMPLKQVFHTAQTQLDEAKRRSELMDREIADQLVEANYAAVARDAIGQACKLGAGIIKGPVTSTRGKQNWTQAINEATNQPIVGQYTLQNDGLNRPDARQVDCWHFFPDMSASTMADCEFTFERHLPNKAQFRKMGRRLGFHEETMRAILRDKPQHDGMTDMNYLTQLREIESDNTGSRALNSKYIVLEYHGDLTNEQVCDLLCAVGQHEVAEEIKVADDPLVERRVVIYFCQGKLLKIAPDYPMDSGEPLYSVFSFERGEASIFGAVGIPRLVRHEQSMLNSAVRMMLDNGALSAGPQIIVDKTQIEPENGSWKLTPRKVWKKVGDNVGKSEPFNVVNIPLNQAQLAGIIELALKFIDEVAAMPTIAQGEAGAYAKQTASGLSMLFNSANVIFRRVVKNWDDDITTPLIRRFYDWNMQFNEKPEIKGDMQTEARGTSVLLVREIQSQQLMYIAQNWSQHPIIGPAIKAYEVVRMTLQTMNINPGDVLVEPDDFEKRIAAMAESEQASPDQIRAEASIQVATIDAESRKVQTDTTLQIANLNRDTEIMKLMQRDGVDIKKIMASLEATRMKTESDERKLAVEVGVEQMNAKRAEAMGQQPNGSGGTISMGTKDV